MGSPGTISIRVELELALSVGDYRQARRLAASVGRIGLNSSLRLTVLAARKDPGHFDLLARDWICQALEERALTLSDMSWITPQLQKVQDGRWHDGERLLLIMCHRQSQ